MAVLDEIKRMPDVPHVDSSAFQPFPAHVCADKTFVATVKHNLLRGMLGMRQTVSAAHGTIAAQRLLAARLPPEFMKQHVHWKEGDTYEAISKRRLDLLNGVFPDW